MISSHRTTKAFEQGMNSAIQTRCNPQRAECRYYRGTAQHRAFNMGWNRIFKPFRKMLAPAHMAQKIAED